MEAVRECIAAHRQPLAAYAAVSTVDDNSGGGADDDSDDDSDGAQAELTIGDAVTLTWSGEHDLIPRGSVGEIIEVRGDGKLKVQFPNATSFIKPKNLKRATG